IIPKVFFFLGHVFAQHFCSRNDVFVMFPLHYDPSVTAEQFSILSFCHGDKPVYALTGLPHLCAAAR
ncbi:MAG: hypothetical protein ACI3XO_07045, partial [Eubacteriales bacterium]